MRLSRRQLLQGLAVGAVVGCGGSAQPGISLYCAQDRDFAMGLLEEFRQKTGIEVGAKFDTEANKSVGLYREIVAEKNRPRCDLFWNNEILSTLRLQRLGVLESYASPVAKPYPSWAKADDGTWTAFASRARILLVNEDRLGSREVPTSLIDLTDPKWRNEVVLARPSFGTTATHVACLFDVLGAERAREFLLALKGNGLRLAPGNKQVAEWIGRGRTVDGSPVCLGLTDTDDAILEIRAGSPVRIVYLDQDEKAKLGTLFIPNTLCIPNGCPNPSGAKRLLDFLLSAEVEKKLAEGPSAQIPLNPNVKASLPSQIKTPNLVKVMNVDWLNAASRWDDAQRFVTETFAVGTSS